MRRVTSERAARLGTYPVVATASSTTVRRAGSTVVAPLITRDTVARETPATAATSSKVGRTGGSTSAVMQPFIPAAQRAGQPRACAAPGSPSSSVSAASRAVTRAAASCLASALAPAVISDRDTCAEWRR